MLGIHGVRRGGADYYLSDLAPELPVSNLPLWAGRAAQGMGLEGRLDPDTLCHLLEGRLPRTGQPIGSSRVQVAAFDLTFSAPKSVSVLYALGGPETARQVVAGHVDAVAGALSYLEVHGVTARRRSGEDRVVLPTSGAAAGLFTHGVNRNGDPHLHSHVVMANLVHGVDGRWSACDWRGLDAHRRAASAVYEAHLRSALTSARSGSVGGTPRGSPTSPASRPRSSESSRPGTPTSAAGCMRSGVTRPGPVALRGRQRGRTRRRASPTRTWCRSGHDGPRPSGHPT